MIRSYENNGNKIECFIQGKELYFKAKEVARSLDYTDTQKAVSDHVREKYRYLWSDIKGPETGLSSSHPQTVYLSEPGLYQLILSSHMPKAEEFQDWVLEDVLPQIRKTGKYTHFDSPNKLVFKIENEFDLHKKVVDYIRRFHNNLLVVAGLGENQDTKEKRIKSWQKGYRRGQPDLIINNYHKKYKGFCIELKTPKGNGKLSEAQEKLLGIYKSNGFKVLVCNDYDVLCRSVDEYSKDIRLPCELCRKRYKSQKTLKSHMEGFHKISHTYNE